MVVVVVRVVAETETVFAVVVVVVVVVVVMVNLSTWNEDIIIECSFNISTVNEAGCFTKSTGKGA